ncbi:MAG: CRISPR-associated helicase Cas3' [Ignavibacteriae bacterium]|nr:CRISPR-associated helicase Cas3' [Ignavibacteriota bacterium]MCB9216869.1 CRISPR-associated helicase Cas3' [Ignavibacteria bacterium]
MNQSTTTTDLLYRLWGKTNERSKKKDGENWEWRMHPAICHMVDVGYVAETWLTMNPHLLARFHSFAPEIEPDLLKSIIVTIVALHDLGKIHRSFQSKSDNGWEVGYGTTAVERDPQSTGFDHGRATGIIMRELFAREFKTWRTWRKAFDVAAGHHGTLYLSSQLENNNAKTFKEYYDERPFILQAIHELSSLFGMSSEIPKAPKNNAFHMLLAGFTAACDWLGSDSTIYDYYDSETKPLLKYEDLEKYLGHLRNERVGQRQLQNAGLIPGIRRAPYSYQDLFSIFSKYPLRPLQEASLSIPFGKDSGSEVVVVEAPMGMGKTEIALYLAAQAIGAGHADGIYFALPTQASSNALFNRIVEFAQAICEDESQLSVVLAHGGSRYDNRYQDMRRRTYAMQRQYQETVSRIGNYQDDYSPPSELIVTDWLQPSKQALLGAVGVGTIDQALLGSIRVKHAFVRLFALANKVVLCDEIHAYDIYQDSLVKHLLRWLSALGVKVIMLSATLPQSLRRGLMQPFGYSSDQEELKKPEDDPYPQILHCKDGILAEPYTIQSEANLPEESRAIKIVPMQVLNEERTSAGVARALSLVREGGSIAWLRNTVKEAIEAWHLIIEQLKSTGRNDIEVRLIHSRFLRPDRNQIEESLVEVLGPPNEKRQRPTKMIVIATQVIEQSVDIDFDAMISDLAPIDLLLQRLGRMWRHQRPLEIRQGHTSPVLTVLMPTDDELYEMQMGSSAYVYDAEILTRTALLVREHPEWLMPLDCRRLVAFLYDHEERWTAEAQKVSPDKLESIRSRRLAEEKAAEGNAKQILMPGPTDRLEMETARKDDDQGNRIMLTTRRGHGGGTVVLLEERSEGLCFLGKPEVNATQLPNAEAYPELVKFDEAILLSSISFPWWGALEPPEYEHPEMSALNQWWRDRKPFDNKIFLLLDSEGKTEHPQFTASYHRTPEGTPLEGLTIEKRKKLTENEIDYSEV